MALVFALLFTVVQVGVLLLVDPVSTRVAHERNVQELKVGERVFLRLVDQNRQRLLQAAEVLSGDYAFRNAVATGDSATISSALNNHGARIRANVMMLVSPGGALVADSVQPVDRPRQFPNTTLIREAERNGKAWAIMPIDSGLYQVVVVPVLAPDPIAWVAMGFSVDQSFLDDLSALTSLHVSFLTRETDGGWEILATTQPREVLGESLARLPGGGAREPLRLADFDTIMFPLADQAGSKRIQVALQRSVSEGLEPLERLTSLLALVVAASIVASIVGSVILARRIMQPLAAMGEFAQHVRDGDYSGRLALQRSDELGALSASFNHMLEGIQARESEVLRLAFEDTLTGLPNRVKFNECLTRAIEEYRRSALPVAVLLMDLDRFKVINDTLGHDAGDQVLKAVATRLRESLRESDLVARLGGDEFAVLLTGGDSSRPLAVARMIHAILEKPIELDAQPVDVGSSIGIAQCPAHGEEPGLLLRNADIAMYAAKRERAGMAVYEPSYEQHRASHLSLLSDLRKAIADNALLLYYQPKVDLVRGQLVGVEALVRWSHPQRGVIPPSEFIPFAEQTGTIRHVTRWVIEEAIRQCGVWLSGGMALNVSLNVSSRDLLDRELPYVLAGATRRHGVAPDLVTVEVTESALMEDPPRAQETIRSLKEQGLRLAIDDYGTGYSSLAYIQRLQCDELKVDRAFVTHVAGGRKEAAIVRSTIELGHSLGLTVVAEGVEEPETMNLLRQFGCDIAQGYGISRPLSASQLDDWIARCQWKAMPSRRVPALVGDRLRVLDGRVAAG
jgi:diguanylate cyclase (GGDEF)-like protein